MSGNHDDGQSPDSVSTPGADPNGGHNVTELLAAAYAVDGPDGNRDLYRRWAATYDDDFIQASGYVYHERVVDLLLEASPQLGSSDAVLDVGCGTGAVGEVLRARGVEHVDGIDISPEMLERAGTKTVDGVAAYRELIVADLTGPIDVPSDRYAALISTGAFTHGHLGPDALDELVRVCASGALCAIGINASHFADHGFDHKINALVEDGAVASATIDSAPIYARSSDAEPDSIARVALLVLA